MRLRKSYQISKIPTIDNIYETGEKKAQKKVRKTFSALCSPRFVIKNQQSASPSTRKTARSTSMRFAESILKK